MVIGFRQVTRPLGRGNDRAPVIAVEGDEFAKREHSWVGDYLSGNEEYAIGNQRSRLNPNLGVVPELGETILVVVILNALLRRIVILAIICLEAGSQVFCEFGLEDVSVRILRLELN